MITKRRNAFEVCTQLFSVIKLGQYLYFRTYTKHLRKPYMLMFRLRLFINFVCNSRYLLSINDTNGCHGSDSDPFAISVMLAMSANIYLALNIFILG